MEAWWIGLAASGTSGKMASSITVGRSCLLAKSAGVLYEENGCKSQGE